MVSGVSVVSDCAEACLFDELIWVRELRAVGFLGVSLSRKRLLPGCKRLEMWVTISPESITNGVRCLCWPRRHAVVNYLFESVHSWHIVVSCIWSVIVRRSLELLLVRSLHQAIWWCLLLCWGWIIYSWLVHHERIIHVMHFHLFVLLEVMEAIFEISERWLWERGRLRLMILLRLPSWVVGNGARLRNHLLLLFQ